MSGIDGSGKTTVAKRIVEVLTELEICAVYSRPKYRTCKQFEFYFEQTIGDPTAFNRQPDATIYFNGLLIDWLTHLADFISQQESKVIVLDRYVYDVLAQGMHIGADVTHFDWLLEKMPKANIEVLLDVDITQCNERVVNRDGKIIRRFETIESMTDLDAIYKTINSTSQWKPITIKNVNLENTTSAIVRMLKEELAEWGFPSSYYCPHELAPLCDYCDSYEYP